jgi:hypothetical protein
LDPYPDPDQLVRGTDPGIRIRIKMSRIPKTGFLDAFCYMRFRKGSILTFVICFLNFFILGLRVEMRDFL